MPWGWIGDARQQSARFGDENYKNKLKNVLEFIYFALSAHPNLFFCILLDSDWTQVICKLADSIKMQWNKFSI